MTAASPAIGSGWFDDCTVVCGTELKVNGSLNKDNTGTGSHSAVEVEITG